MNQTRWTQLYCEHLRMRLARTVEGDEVECCGGRYRSLWFCQDCGKWEYRN